MLRRMNKIPMTRVCLHAATRGATARVLVRMINQELKGKYVPQKREKPQPVIEGHFDALAMISEKKIPDAIRTAVEHTCKSCSLYAEASPSMCRECPLPDFLRRL